MKLVKAGAGAVIITLDKELSVSIEKEITDLISSLSPSEVQNILLDFNPVEIFDNTGLNLLLRLYIQSKKYGRNMIAIGVIERFLDIFKLSGLDKAYWVYASVSEVLKVTGVKDTTTIRNLFERVERSGVCVGPAFSCWATFTGKLTAPTVSKDAINLNIGGRYTAGPEQGFGQLWEKTYSIDLSESSLSPAEIIAELKNHFSEFQPSNNRFYVTDMGIRPGEVIVINAQTPGGLVATGVLVLYAGESTFTFITPQGHPESGWVTLRCFEEKGRTIMEIQGFARASDPIYEIAFRIIGSKVQQQTWTYLLQALAKKVGCYSQVRFSKRCLDRSLQWSHFCNVFRNAQILSMLYSLFHLYKSTKVKVSL
jgi:anti-anti-sigma factor